jgi:hypothetical protein
LSLISLEPDDQYYTEDIPSAESRILRDVDKCANIPILCEHHVLCNINISFLKRSLDLRIDRDLSDREIKLEAEKVVKRGGDDMFKNHTSMASPGTHFMNMAGEIGMGLGKQIHSDLRKKQLRMWKRSDKRRRENGGGIPRQFFSNVFSVIENTFDGTFGADIDDGGAEDRYDSIPAQNFLRYFDGRLVDDRD